MTSLISSQYQPAETTLPADVNVQRTFGCFVRERAENASKPFPKALGCIGQTQGVMWAAFTAVDLHFVVVELLPLGRCGTLGKGYGAFASHFRK